MLIMERGKENARLSRLCKLRDAGRTQIPQGFRILVHYDALCDLTALKEGSRGTGIVRIMGTFSRFHVLPLASEYLDRSEPASRLRDPKKRVRPYDLPPDTDRKVAGSNSEAVILRF